MRQTTRKLHSYIHDAGRDALGDTLRALNVVVTPDVNSHGQSGATVPLEKSEIPTGAKAEVKGAIGPSEETCPIEPRDAEARRPSKGGNDNDSSNLR